MLNCLRPVISLTCGRIKIYINNSSLCVCKMCSMPTYPKELTHVRPICVCKRIAQRLLLLSLLLLLFLSFYLCLRHKYAGPQVTLSTSYSVLHYVVTLHASSLCFLYLYSYTYIVLFRLMTKVLDVISVDDTTIPKILVVWVYE